jgi:hypothetical protein
LPAPIPERYTVAVNRYLLGLVAIIILGLVLIGVVPSPPGGDIGAHSQPVGSPVYETGGGAPRP